MIPKKVETCPCCDKRLDAHAEGWYEENGIWWPDEVKVDCVRGMRCYNEYKDAEQWRMPYVYWLPVEQHCERWITRMLRIYYKLDPMPLKWLELNGQIPLPITVGR